MVMLTEQTIQLDSTVIDHWWRCMRGEHRLFLRLYHESVENLMKLPYLKAIIQKIKATRIYSLISEYPICVDEIRTYLFSAQRYFIGCLQAILTNNLQEAQVLYNLVHAEMSMLQYNFMKLGIKTYI